MKEPPPEAVLASRLKAPEPVNRRMSPAVMGVPGMVDGAMAELGPIRLKEYDVAGLARAMLRKAGAIATRMSSVLTIVFLAIWCMLRGLALG